MSENCNYAPVEKVILIDDRRKIQRESTGTGTLDQ